MTRIPKLGESAPHQDAEKEDRLIVTTTRNRISRIVDLFTDAIATAAAVEGGRQPKAHHLRGLGIDPAQFRTIRR